MLIRWAAKAVFALVLTWWARRLHFFPLAVCAAKLAVAHVRLLQTGSVVWAASFCFRFFLSIVILYASSHA
jgi:hypothetical protein